MARLVLVPVLPGFTLSLLLIWKRKANRLTPSIQNHDDQPTRVHDVADNQARGIKHRSHIGGGAQSAGELFFPRNSDPLRDRQGAVDRFFLCLWSGLIRVLLSHHNRHRYAV